MQNKDWEKTKERIIEVADRIIHLHFCENGREEVKQYLGEGFSWIGIFDEGIRTEEKEGMGHHKRPYEGKLATRPVEPEYDVQKISEECYICICRAWITVEAAMQMCLKTHQRISFFFRMEGTEPKCYHVHASNPYIEDVTEDFLTGVYNRRYVTRLIEEYLDKENGCGFLLADIDNFKMINDTYGHVRGDEVLERFSELLQKMFSADGVCGRLGGDEFIIFLPGKVTSDFAEELALQLTEGFREVLREMQIEVSAGVSIGGVYGMQKTTFEELYRKADAILYQVKENGKGKVSILQSSYT